MSGLLLSSFVFSGVLSLLMLPGLSFFWFVGFRVVGIDVFGFAVFGLGVFGFGVFGFTGSRF